MALLLSLETSTQYCSAALHDQGVLVASRSIETPRSAASLLAVMIDEVLHAADHVPADLNGVVVTSGPGSYTGLRIGVATAKGLCYALGIPLLSVNTLELLAFQLLKNQVIKLDSFDDLLLCPMLDARRMEVYCALFDQHLNYIEPVQAKIIDGGSFNEILQRRQVIFFGEGADKCQGVIVHDHAQFVSGIKPLATSLGELGYIKWKSGVYEDLVSFEPFYLKDFLIKKPNVLSDHGNN